MQEVITMSEIYMSNIFFLDSDIDVPYENVLLDEDFIIRNGRKNMALNKFLYVNQTPWQRQLLKR